MLLYSTILDIKENVTKDDFIQLVIEWNQTSNHDENIIKGISWNGERNIRFGNDKLWLEIIEYRNKNIIAVRYEKVADDGAIWDTDYIMNFDEMRMAIRLDRSYLEEAVVTNKEFSTPHFVTLLIQKGFLKKDGDFEVMRDALEIDGNNAALLNEVIEGTAKHQLPIVYVSKTFANTEPLHVGWLCSRLKGTAHVLVQKDNSFTAQLRSACAGKNMYNGAIGIYYPNDALGTKICMYKEGYEKQLLDKVVNFVLQYSVLQRIDTLYTWQGVSNSLLKDRLASQREERLEAERARAEAEEEKNKADDRAEEVYEIVDEELKALQRQVEELTRDNMIKDCENQALREKLAQVDAKPVLVQGEEEDLYPGEIRDIVLAAISEHLDRNIKKGSRREHVLADILNSNKYEKLSEKKREALKNLFSGYTGMNASLKSGLQELGFTVKEEGKHHKLILGDDQRYWTTLACTPGDNRGVKNEVSDICNSMF